MLEAARPSDGYEAEWRVTLTALKYIKFPVPDGKRKIVLVHIIREHEGSGGTDPLIPNDDTRWGSRQLHTPTCILGKVLPVYHLIEGLAVPIACVETFRNGIIYFVFNFFYFLQWTNKRTINWQFIIIPLHVSTLMCHLQAARSQYLLSTSMQSWWYNLKFHICYLLKLNV